MGGTISPRISGLWGTQDLLAARFGRAHVVQSKTAPTLFELYRVVVEPLTYLRREGPTYLLTEQDRG